MEKQSILKKVVNKQNFLEVIRFLIIGGIATIVDYLAMGVYEYFMEPTGFDSFLDVFTRNDIKTSVVMVGTTLGFLSGLIVNYVFSITFVYEEKGNSKTALGFAIFSILSLIGLLISNVGMWLGYDICNFNQWIVKIVMTIIVMCYNYISKRLIIFKKSGEEVNEKED